MKVICINTSPLKGKDVSPPLRLNQEYEVVKIIKDSKGNEHYDLGLKSEYNYVSSQETGEHLPNSGVGGVHWCHPSRFTIIEK